MNIKGHRKEEFHYNLTAVWKRGNKIKNKKTGSVGLKSATVIRYEFLKKIYGEYKIKKEKNILKMSIKMLPKTTVWQTVAWTS